MQDNNELQNRREKLIKSIGESLGLADLSEESFEAERRKLQKGLDESAFKIRQYIETGKRQYIEMDKLMPSPGEIKSAVKEFNIKSDELTLKLHEKSKNGTPLEKHTALADYQLEMFKLDFLHAFTKHSLIIIQDLEYILETIMFILGLANEVSIKKKLSAIKEIRSIVLRSDTKAKQLLEMEELGLHESNSKSIVVAMKQQIPKEVYSNPDALMFTPLITDPIFVAKNHIPMYDKILKLLDREEEMILIELRNGKSLDYSPLNDKKDNGNPTAAATVKDGNLVLFQREIALIYHYENWLLTDENANDEVRKYLQKDGTRHKSGKALMADYRIVNGKFKDWLSQKNTIKYLKKIIPLLQNQKGINDANEDLRQAIKNRESLF